MNITKKELEKSQIELTVELSSFITSCANVARMLRECCANRNFVI